MFEVYIVVFVIAAIFFVVSLFPKRIQLQKEANEEVKKDEMSMTMRKFLYGDWL